MKTIKLPRKLKKRLKQDLLSKVGKEWKSKDIKLGIRKTSFPALAKRINMPAYKGTIVQSFTLG